MIRVHCNVNYDNILYIRIMVYVISYLLSFIVYLVRLDSIPLTISIKIN